MVEIEGFFVNQRLRRRTKFLRRTQGKRLQAQEPVGLRSQEFSSEKLRQGLCWKFPEAPRYRSPPFPRIRQPAVWRLREIYLANSFRAVYFQNPFTQTLSGMNRY